MIKELTKFLVVPFICAVGITTTVSLAPKQTKTEVIAGQTHGFASFYLHKHNKVIVAVNLFQIIKFYPKDKDRTYIFLTNSDKPLDVEHPYKDVWRRIARAARK